MFCFHKFGYIVNGYQYCTKCNKAITAPRKEECNHVWVLEQAYKGGDIPKYVRILRCSQCGIATKQEIYL